MGKVEEWWDRYFEWWDRFPDWIAAPCIIASLVIPLVSICFLFGSISFSIQRSTCLDSEFARRFYRSNRDGFICEEYHDNEWIKVNLYNDKVFYYNDAGSKK